MHYMWFEYIPTHSTKHTHLFTGCANGLHSTFLPQQKGNGKIRSGSTHYNPTHMDAIASFILG